MTQLSTKLPWELAQTKWPAALNPILALAMLQGNQLNNIALTASTPLVINHFLGKMMQGWFITDITANTAIWRTAPFNSLNITLESSVNVTISLWVY